MRQKDWLNPLLNIWKTINLQDGLPHPDGFESINWRIPGQLLKMIHNKFDSNTIDDIGAGEKKERSSDTEIIICYTGGLPTEDVVWGYHVYKNALKNNIGVKLPLWNEPFLV